MAQSDTQTSKEQIPSDLATLSPQQSQKKCNGHWTMEEHEKYLEFFQKYKWQFHGKRIFKPLSQAIGTRTPSQCRSHHQKFNPLKKGKKSSINKKKIQKTTKQLARQFFAQLKRRIDTYY